MSWAPRSRPQRQVLASVITKYSERATSIHGSDARLALSQSALASMREKRNASRATLTLSRAATSARLRHGEPRGPTSFDGGSGVDASLVAFADTEEGANAWFEAGARGDRVSWTMRRGTLLRFHEKITASCAF